MPITCAIKGGHDGAAASAARFHAAPSLLASNGKPVKVNVQIAEKIPVSFELTVKNPGGHSAVPRKDNAIYHLAEGLARLGKFDFPLHLTDTTRTYFERSAAREKEPMAADMRAAIADSPDPAAIARLSAIPAYNALLRTTCVATMLQAGQAINALPQLASAKVNCRIIPGETADEVKARLIQVLADDEIMITQLDPAVPSDPSKFNEEVGGAIEKLSREFWPGSVVIPLMSAGATDGSFLRNAGIPTYGHSGMALEPGDSARIHGRDERVPVKSFYEGNEYLYRLVKMLAGGA